MLRPGSKAFIKLGRQLAGFKLETENFETTSDKTELIRRGPKLLSARGLNLYSQMIGDHEDIQPDAQTATTSNASPHSGSTQLP
ncbi:hypothetical protein PoB_005705800 [Plakobranchus ocellatus]|uniref:Uncharacterized protein n=1 Tax=Plakobranchus ocellatus TaxID=259542 RepID=A0AAV4CHM0_9GAST|nr:hypothetical protein PoB_005705800 [Plakobranchus ocellatus]